MASGFLFDALRMHLKARGMTYADVARALKVSEPTVKRIFAGRNCTLKRLDEMCDVLQVELAELTRTLPRAARLISQLTKAQEEELMSDPALLCVAACAMHQMRVEEIVRLYRLDEAQCVRLLLRLERLGILELHENNRIRLRLSRAFSWIPDGPMMRFVRGQAGDFFDHAFGAAGETMRLLSVRLSAEGRVALLRQIEQVLQEYAEQHAADARLPLDARQPVSILLGVRAWEPKAFKALRRRAERASEAQRRGARLDSLVYHARARDDHAVD
jgi:transcriptional regulator with XRE-family HTH domain